MCPIAPNRKEDRPSIVIVGGGHAGLALAAHLLSYDLKCRVFERRSRLDLLADTNSFYDMASSGIQALLRIANGAAAPAIFDAAVAYDKMAIYLGKGRTPLTSLEWRDNSLGMPMFNVTRAAMLKGLCEAVEQLDPDCISFETTVTLLDHELGTVEIEGPHMTKETVQANLVVGADGIHSRLRKKVFGDTGLRSDGIVACYAVLPPLTEQEKKVFPKPPGVGEAYGVLGMAHDFCQYAVVNKAATIWYVNFSLDDKPYVTVPPTPEHGWLGEARKRCQGGIPMMMNLIDRTEEEDLQVVACCDRIPLDTYSSGRVVLVGDAAHPFTPFAGVGSSAALVDAFCLGEALLKHQSCSEAVKFYEKQRLKPANDLMNESRALCATDFASRFRFAVLEVMFGVGKWFGKAEAIAHLMILDGDSMVNKLIAFKTKEAESEYEARYKAAKSRLEAQI